MVSLCDGFEDVLPVKLSHGSIQSDNVIFRLRNVYHFSCRTAAWRIRVFMKIVTQNLYRSRDRGIQQ